MLQQQLNMFPLQSPNMSKQMLTDLKRVGLKREGQERKERNWRGEAQQADGKSTLLETAVGTIALRVQHSGEESSNILVMAYNFEAEVSMAISICLAREILSTNSSYRVFSALFSSLGFEKNLVALEIREKINQICIKEFALEVLI